jgi:hypothetical protein
MPELSTSLKRKLPMMADGFNRAKTSQHASNDYLKLRNISDKYMRDDFYRQKFDCAKA